MTKGIVGTISLDGGKTFVTVNLPQEHYAALMRSVVKQVKRGDDMNAYVAALTTALKAAVATHRAKLIH